MNEKTIEAMTAPYHKDFTQDQLFAMCNGLLGDYLEEYARQNCTVEDAVGIAGDSVTLLEEMVRHESEIALLIADESFNTEAIAYQLHIDHPQTAEDLYEELNYWRGR